MLEKEMTFAGDETMVAPPMTAEGEFVCAIAAIANDNTMTTLKYSLRSSRGIADLPFEVKHDAIAG
jgi:hypothetical protein